MFKSILVAVATAALVSAQSIVSITSPLGNNVYTAGGQAIITWVNPTVDVIPQIQLSKGLSTALQPVMNVATNVSAKDMQYTWNIPATVAPGTDYAFVFGISPNLAYTGQFTIKAADGTAPAASSSPSTGSSAAPAAGSSSPAAAGSSAAASPAKSSAAASSQPTSAAGKVAPVAVSAIAVVGAAAIALM